LGFATNGRPLYAALPPSLSLWRTGRTVDPRFGTLIIKLKMVF